MWDRGEACNINPFVPLVQHVQEKARLVMDRQPCPARKRRARAVLGGDLADRLLVVERHHELVGVLAVERIVRRAPIDAAVGHHVIDEGEAQLLVVLVHQKPVVAKLVRFLEGQRDQVPATSEGTARRIVGGVLPEPWQKRERTEIAVFVGTRHNVELALACIDLIGDMLSAVFKHG